VFFLQTKPFVHVQDIVVAHWKAYGRNYYSRYDYEGVPTTAANTVMNNLRSQFGSLNENKQGLFGSSFVVARADEFTYVDPIDGSISKNQGIRVLFTDGSRVVFRLSGTAGSGATIRVYFEKYEASEDKLLLPTAVALQELLAVGLQISNIHELTGFSGPTVIT
jgi:phosphoglucomutase